MGVNNSLENFSNEKRNAHQIGEAQIFREVLAVMCSVDVQLKIRSAISHNLCQIHSFLTPLCADTEKSKMNYQEQKHCQAVSQGPH